ncbi:FAD-dependent pyridine nucleotide-disulfide oxidoreductase [Russula earlei]|uniref:FAD-dependent pyridine nucleotide-disulfide oxidoreductase n=1 Tax=Russula earlei TaxID=71964 RepID=A0ACC0TU04_9AGAM|nr:FAD-dependent pyridine nucleotide-disulfide oxidoreductase [Russula earlei]
MKKYDAIIIGSGQAGTPLARRLAGKGWKVAIIERQYTGGTCINYGCTPTKAMVASAKNAFQARRASEYGITVGTVSVNLPALIARKNKIVTDFRSSTERSLVSIANIELIYGEAFFSGPKQVTISLKEGGKTTCTAEYIFINTGGRTAVPAIEGLQNVPYLTSTTILDAVSIPAHLLIIGGSYIALEFGQMFRRYGSQVTILEHSPRFLPKEDEDIADEMKRILTEEGITIHLGVAIQKVAQDTNNTVTITIIIDGKEQIITGSTLLLAAGRVPNTDQLQLHETGVETDERGYIKVNDRLETAVPGIYALGDVKGGPAFTHISYNDYLVVFKNLVDHANISVTKRMVPYCMFTDPELGRVGMNEEEAKKSGLNFKVAKLPMAYVARGVETGETRGLMKAIVDVDTKKILGVGILGAQGGELMSLLQIAMLGDITYEQLRENIFSHPTYSESINNLFMALDNH